MDWCTTDRAWFTGRATTAQREHRLHAIYATSYKRTGVTFPLAWDRKVNYVYAVNVTDRYAKPEERDDEKPPAPTTSSRVDVEASLHAVAELKKYLELAPAERAALAEREFAAVILTREHAREA